MNQATNNHRGSHRGALTPSRWLLALWVAVASMPLHSCFTGVESTPRITDADLRASRHQERPEMTYRAGIGPEAPATWSKGKSWTVTDARSERVFGTDLRGQEITLADISEAISITGLPEAVISFDSPKGRVSYRTDISADSLMKRRSLNIPYAVENSLIESVRAAMAGKTYYVTTSLWADDSGNSMRGLKYIPVEVVDVGAGRGVYPLSLLLSYAIPVEGVKGTPGLSRSDDSNHRFFFLSMAQPGVAEGTTHAFHDLFSLTDPRKRYPKVSDASWSNIMSGRVSEGMTRDECRLALGVPDEIKRMPAYEGMREIWTYAEGRRLVFSDGLLISAYR